MKGFIKKDNIALFEDLSTECENCWNSVKDYEVFICPRTGEDRRRKRQLAHEHDCFLCLSKSMARNKTVFLERFDIYISSIKLLSQLFKNTRQSAEEIERDKYYKIVHNLRHLNSEALYAQYNFIPQEKFSENYADLFKFVSEEIKKDMKGATLFLLKQSKINAHIKTEFDTHELLSMENPILEFRIHRVREVILNVYHPFERDFKDKNIQLVFSPYIGSARLDYRTMRLAFAHILSNAAKYVKPYTDIVVDFEKNQAKTIISFSMTSILIKESEKESIFIDGFSGDIPKLHNLNGSGLGMGLIRKAVELNNGTFTVEAGKTHEKVRNGLSYAANCFKITLFS